MILVTGASGTVGTALLRPLAAAGRVVRAAYHTRRPTGSSIEPVRIDAATGEGVDEAVRGVEAIFLLLGDMSDQAAAEVRIVEAARRAGVRRIVKLSALGAETEAYSYARLHRAVERAIEGAGMDWTFLRPGTFMQNFVNYFGDAIRSEGAIALPAGQTREAFIDARDIAAVAARALLETGHEGKAYDLLGPEALSYAEAAAILCSASGRPIAYIDLPEEDFARSMLEAGQPQFYVDDLLDMYRYMRSGRLPHHSTAVKDITARDPIRLQQFARENAAAWR